MNRWPARLLLLVLALAVPSIARAHEGETHAEDAPSTTGVVAAVDTHIAESDVHELVVRAGTILPREKATLRLLLADRATNAPITGATIEVTDGARDTTWNARATAPGVYLVDAVFPDTGLVRLDVLVRRGEDLDLLSIEGIRVGAPPDGAPVAARSLPPWGYGALAGAGLLALGGLVGLARRRARAARQTAALVLALALAAGTSSPTRAHEGELHGDEPAPPPIRAGEPAIPGARYVAKEAQFELGLLTAVAHTEDVESTRHATGVVAVDPAGSVDVIAPMGGKFVARRAWQVGDRVGRGQALGGILVVDELPVRAPIGGTIAQLGAVPGQTVAAGQLLARVVDLSRVRIELPLYGAALSEGLAARTATVRVAGTAGAALKARVVGLAPGGAAQGGPGAPFVLTVHDPRSALRPGMVVDAWLELPGHVHAVVVPSTALVETESGPAVFVKIAPEAFVLRPVTLGPRAGDRVGILAGVKDGDRVVVAGTGPLLAVVEAPR